METKPRINWSKGYRYLLTLPLINVAKKVEQSKKLDKMRKQPIVAKYKKTVDMMLHTPLEKLDSGMWLAFIGNGYWFYHYLEHKGIAQVDIEKAKRYYQSYCQKYAKYLGDHKQAEKDIKGITGQIRVN
ncbi:MAG: hypothetical protein AJITA_00997 [Acetilactobacillus jinshanensis]